VKTLASFYDHLLPELPGCTTAMLDLHLLLWAREFCTTGHVWRADFDAVDLVADQPTYDLDASETQSEAVKVIRLTVDDILLYDELWSDDSQADTGPKYPAGHPPFTLSDTMLEITLLEDEIPTAAVTGGLEVYGSMRPKATATSLPDFFLQEHVEAMRMGVLSRLMRMAKKPWSNPALAQEYASQYQSLLQFAATNAQRGNTRAPLRVRKWG
jgi:hypothetical protein